MIKVLNELRTTTDILLLALREGDHGKAHEAVSVMLMQGMTMLGEQHPVMQQFFPVWNAIEIHISSGDNARALGQTETWKRQLEEVIEIVEANTR
jgi:hypothetical protein